MFTVPANLMLFYPDSLYFFHLYPKNGHVNINFFNFYNGLILSHDPPSFKAWAATAGPAPSVGGLLPIVEAGTPCARAITTARAGLLVVGTDQGELQGEQ